MTLLSCRDISKSFAGVAALDGVDFDLAAGEIHGLVGANGAGKSTLMKILSGALPDHGGEIRFEGEPIRLSSPHAALANGIAMVYQELSGIGQLSVAENLFLGRQPAGRLGRIRWREMRRRAREALREVGLDIDITRRLDSFPLAARQLIEIARGLEAGGRILILDEPTSALSPPETRRLFDLMRSLRGRGKGIIFISHFIEDVLEICDRVTALAAGSVKLAAPAAGLAKHEVIHAMLGGNDPAEETAMESAVELPPTKEGAPLIEARGLARRGHFEAIDFAIRPGEALGLYGFVGAGHQEVAHCVAGASRADAGEVLWEGSPARISSPAHAVRMGIAFVAADRAASLVAKSEIYKNVTLARLGDAVGGWLTRRREIAVAEPCISRVGCRPPDPRLPAGSLSGGNQQKVVLAKWLLGPVRLLVLEEPTRGMDVGAKAEVMRIVGNLQREGASILLASSEPELLLAHADRILVMRRGRIAEEFAGRSVDKAELMRYAG